MEHTVRFPLKKRLVVAQPCNIMVKHCSNMGRRFSQFLEGILGVEVHAPLKPPMLSNTTLHIVWYSHSYFYRLNSLLSPCSRPKIYLLFFRFLSCLPSEEYPELSPPIFPHAPTTVLWGCVWGGFEPRSPSSKCTNTASPRPATTIQPQISIYVMRDCP